MGMLEALDISVADMKQSLKGRFFDRLKKVLSLLSGGNKMHAINSWAIQVMMCTFSILKWT